MAIRSGVVVLHECFEAAEIAAFRVVLLVFLDVLVGEGAGFEGSKDTSSEDCVIFRVRWGVAPVLYCVIGDGSAGAWLFAIVGGVTIMESGLLDDVLRCSKDELCGVGEVCPFFGEDFFDEEFIFEVFTWLGG